jgi:AbrB family looped-hinge helix DNA binding protein
LTTIKIAEYSYRQGKDMEIATITSEGQIIIPQEIREKMDLRNGDKIVFIEENGKYYFQNSNSLALANFQNNMKGATEEAGFSDPDDAVEYIKQLRRNKQK